MLKLNKGEHSLKCGLCSIIRLVAKLEETNPSEVELFKTNMNKVMKDLLGRFKDLQFFTGNYYFHSCLCTNVNPYAAS